MNKVRTYLKKFIEKNFKKGFNTYYLLVLTVILLTGGTQAIVQYSLSRQSSNTFTVNLAGRQRMLSQKAVKEFYNCKYSKDCEYGDLRSTLASLYRVNKDLQIGNENLGIRVLEKEEIQNNFKKLKPYLDGIYYSLYDYKNIKKVSIDKLKADEESFLLIMDEIVGQFQKESEKEIRNMMIIEKYLAILSVVIILIEILFIVNPIIDRIVKQKKKLEEIAWHQSHAFTNHVKNIKDHQYVLKVEKDPERQKEIIKFVVEELDGVEEVSQFMVKALKKA